MKINSKRNIEQKGKILRKIEKRKYKKIEKNRQTGKERQMKMNSKRNKEQMGEILRKIEKRENIRTLRKIDREEKKNR